jgi:hypothetical protein
VRTRPSRRRRLLVPILLAGALSLGATAAAGIQPSPLQRISDSAFVPATVDAPAVGGRPNQMRRGDASQTPDAAPIADPWLSQAPPAERARPSLPPSQPVAVARPTYTHSISGRASWYCDAGVSPCTADHPDTGAFQAYAAAGPRLRAAIGPGWRGMVVSVDGIRVKLIDWCQCYQGESNEKLLDLYHDVYLRTGSAVTVRW